MRKIGNDDVLQPAVSGLPVYGVLQNLPRDNEHASVCIEGLTKLTFGASLGGGIQQGAGNSQVRLYSILSA